MDFSKLRKTQGFQEKAIREKAKVELKKTNLGRKPEIIELSWLLFNDTVSYR